MREAYELYFGCKIGNKKRFGCRELAAVHVQGLWQGMDEESEGFNYSGQKFAKISEDKRKEGIFIGLQIKQLFEDHDFNTKLSLQTPN